MALIACLTILFTFFILSSAQVPTNAPQINNNPTMATYQAILQQPKPIQGTITGVSGTNGTGVDFNINFHGFPDPDVGPYTYHIHVNPIANDGNCTSAGGHLDPHNVTDAFKCPGEAAGETCQVGDLSGKHGKIDLAVLNTPSFQTQYLDRFISTVPNTTAFLGNRSVVIHDKDGKRLNCGNFVLQYGDVAGANGTTNGSATDTSQTDGPSATATGVGTGTETATTPSSTDAVAVDGASSITTSSVSALVALAAIAIVAAAGFC